MELLNHLNRRIKTNLNVALPLKDLLDYVSIFAFEKNSLGLVRFFSLFAKTLLPTKLDI